MLYCPKETFFIKMMLLLSNNLLFLQANRKGFCYGNAIFKIRQVDG